MSSNTSARRSLHRTSDGRRSAGRTRPPRLRRTLLAGGTDGNERLTVLTGALLIVLTAAIGVTIIRIGQLMWLHLFLGLVLLGPVVLKLGSVGYRFVRYYTQDAGYRRKGPPVPVLRGLAPLVVAATIALFGTGVALLFAGPHTGLPLGMLHKVSFFVWIALTAIHVLGHLPEILRALPGAGRTRRDVVPMTAGAGRRADSEVAGGSGRLAVMGAAVAMGLVVAVALIGQFSLWTQGHRGPHQRPPAATARVAGSSVRGAGE